MPRKKILQTSRFPYHVTARVNNRELFPTELTFVWKTLTSELYLQGLFHGAKVHAFVLMPNHFHLLISTPSAPISKVMQELISSSTRIINTRAHRTGHLFGGRYHWTVIDDALYFAHAIKYVYRNPVKAGLCESVADHSFSTFSGLIGNNHLPIAVHTPPSHLDRLLPADLCVLDAWLNQPHRAEENEAIKKALKKKEFKIKVNRNNRKPLYLSQIDAPPLPKGV